MLGSNASFGSPPKGVGSICLRVFYFRRRFLPLLLPRYLKTQLSREMVYHEIYHFTFQDWRLPCHLHRFR